MQFYQGIRESSGITINWQCWYDEITGWTFDDSEVWGCAGLVAIAEGVNSVTGQTIQQMGLEGQFNYWGGCIEKLTNPRVWG